MLPTKALPLAPFKAVLRLKRRISRECMVSVGGNLYSVPDATRRRPVEVHTQAEEIRIFEDGVLIASHPVLEGRRQHPVAAGHRKGGWSSGQRRPDGAVVLMTPTGDIFAQRLLKVYDAIGHQLAQGGRA